MTEDTKQQAELTDSIPDPPVPDVAAVNISTRHYISLHATDGDRSRVRVEKCSFEMYCLFISLSVSVIGRETSLLSLHQPARH